MQVDLVKKNPNFEVNKFQGCFKVSAAAAAVGGSDAVDGGSRLAPILSSVNALEIPWDVLL